MQQRHTVLLRWALSKCENAGTCDHQTKSVAWQVKLIGNALQECVHDQAAVYPSLVVLGSCADAHVFHAQSVSILDVHSVVIRVSNLQGNMDPGVLFGSKETIAQRVVDTVRSAEGTRHVMNLGHGVLVGTPEENVAHFFEVGKSVHERL